ncbi:arf-GAP domain and FG repeat-containing protein 1 isoform X1 [Diorhabda carinulata]|uniref:arf-GAP domain and FG repeat-containing protein 1 isoform X1 n=2 Tax=Diorhabda carinulata TaxID=1163345 RepID=UPI0025A23288|nr:arf-GAP domain and FG repeat-containing protein 1 isoform X1 [Diorhabda carinulata]
MSSSESGEVLKFSMALSRRKQDEKNLKTLRELGALPSNKYCFDCNQRGPTYVNVTIGSFVCTKCSGMLRGITPPHRVKSISMATFTNEEIDILKSRGNDYCRQVWLGLYEGTPPNNNADETTVKDFMVEKYEKRRYYLDPINVKPIEETKTPKINGVEVPPTQRPRPEINRNNANPTRNNNIVINNNANTNGFVADFDKADIFTGTGTTTTNGSISNGTTARSQQQQQQQRNGFANFDNNPVFNNTSTEDFSIFDLKFTDNCGPVLNHVPLFPKCNVNRWSLPSTGVFKNVNTNWDQTSTTANLNGTQNLNGTATVPSEDRYAALKDLDNELKTQKTGSLDWSNSNSSNGSLYSSPTPTGSVYSSPSPQSSIFGSPSQGQFMTAFPQSQDVLVTPNVVSNPFKTNGINWSNLNGGIQTTAQPFANPFNDTIKSNGYAQGFQPIAAFPVPVNGAANGWTPNPFKIGAVNGTNSNNPFL